MANPCSRARTNCASCKAAIDAPAPGGIDDTALDAKELLDRIWCGDRCHEFVPASSTVAAPGIRGSVDKAAPGAALEHHGLQGFGLALTFEHPLQLESYLF